MFMTEFINRIVTPKYKTKLNLHAIHKVRFIIKLWLVSNLYQGHQKKLLLPNRYQLIAWNKNEHEQQISKLNDKLDQDF